MAASRSGLSIPDCAVSPHVDCLARSVRLTLAIHIDPGLTPGGLLSHRLCVTFKNRISERPLPWHPGTLGEERLALGNLSRRRTLM